MPNAQASSIIVSIKYSALHTTLCALLYAMHQHHHKHMSDALCNDLKTAVLPKGSRTFFQIHYDLRRPPPIAWSITG